MKLDYEKSNKNNALRQILNYMALVNNFRMFDLNRARDNKDVKKPLRDVRWYLGSSMLKRVVINLNDATEFCNIPDFPSLVAEYYRKSPNQVEKDEESFLEFPTEHYYVIRIPVQSFQDENE